MNEPKTFVADRVVSKLVAEDPTYGAALLNDVGKSLIYQVGKAVVTEALRNGPQVVAVTSKITESERIGIYDSVLVTLEAQVLDLDSYREWVKTRQAAKFTPPPQEKYAGTNAHLKVGPPTVGKTTAIETVRRLLEGGKT